MSIFLFLIGGVIICCIILYPQSKISVSATVRGDTGSSSLVCTYKEIWMCGFVCVYNYSSEYYTLRYLLSMISMNPKIVNEMRNSILHRSFTCGIISYK